MSIYTEAGLFARDVSRTMSRAKERAKASRLAFKIWPKDREIKSVHPESARCPGLREKCGRKIPKYGIYKLCFMCRVFSRRGRC